MAMMKIVIFYNSGTSGWTETWYQDASNTAAVNLNSSTWRGFLRASLALRNTTTYIYGARVSAVALPHQSILWYFASQYTQSSSFIVQGITDPDVASTDAQYIIYDSTFNKRRIYFRGMQDSLVAYSAAGLPIVNASLTNAVNSYFQYARSLQLQLQTLNPPSPSNPAIRIINITKSAANPNWSTVSITQDSSFPVGKGFQVIFHGINRDLIPGFPLRSQVMQNGVTVATFDIPYLYRGASAIYSPTNATVYSVTYFYSLVDSWTFARFSERKTGRPFGVLRGRARSVVRAQ